VRPERLRQVPEQFSWIDQALVQQRLIDRCDARSAALYLFLVTVADHQGLSHYGGATLTQRLHLSQEQLGAARERLMALDLIAYRAPLYQVLALPGCVASPRPARRAPASGHMATGANSTGANSTGANSTGAGPPVSLAELLQRAQARRG